MVHGIYRQCLNEISMVDLSEIWRAEHLPNRAIDYLDSVLARLFSFRQIPIAYWLCSAALVIAARASVW